MLNLRKYKKHEFHKFVSDRQNFNKQLAKLNYICEDTKTLIDDVQTRIIKDNSIDLQDTEKLINVTKERSTEQTDQPFKILDK